MASGTKQTKIQSALSLHLNNLVQRTQKNLNTGVYTELNPNISPMQQTGIGLASSLKGNRLETFHFQSMKVAGGHSPFGHYHDLNNTSNSNLNRGVTTPQHTNLLLAVPITRPSTSSGPAAAYNK